MPEGDTLHRAARRLQALIGERLEVETPHPRAAAERIAERLDGQRLLADSPDLERMLANLRAEHPERAVYRRAVCPRCRTRIRSRGQGDANRTAYSCPSCQRGKEPDAA